MKLKNIIRGSHGFTLIEILVASTILGLAVAMVVGTIGGARARILRAERRWGRAHVLSQAAEFYLLAGKDGAMPESLLPEGFRAMCELRPAENLPEYATESIQGWPDWTLGEYRVSVFDSYNHSLGEVVVEKIVHEDDYY